MRIESPFRVAIRRGCMVASIALAAISCAQRSGIPVGSPYASWAIAFTTAQQAAARGDYVRADTTLLAYTRSNPGTPEALDAVFWRGVLALDPANPRGSAVTAIAVFDEYLRGGPTLLRRQEAEVMRRLALRLDGTRASEAGGTVARPGDPEDPRDDELRRLREELKRTTEELDRIKRRVASPPPTTPPPDR